PHPPQRSCEETSRAGWFLWREEDFGFLACAARVDSVFFLSLRFSESSPWLAWAAVTSHKHNSPLRFYTREEPKGSLPYTGSNMISAKLNQPGDWLGETH
ncbi:MAG TPA: hypothetical protein VNO32_56375, partial [Candidatus Acidoferrum sp.]|nr:hypothetical protein [Candidatus Acidoferrum sp.]